MTDQAEGAIVGDVYNGKRVQVALGFYTGIAGVRERAGRPTQVAFFGAAPRRVPDPAVGTVDGVEVSILSVAKSSFSSTICVAEVVAIEAA